MNGPKLPPASLSLVLPRNVEASRVFNALENEGFKDTEALAALERTMAGHPEGTRYCLTAQIGEVQGATDVDDKRYIQIRRDGDSNVYLVNTTRRGPGRRGDPLPRKVEVVHRDTRRNDWRAISQSA